MGCVTVGRRCADRLPRTPWWLWPNLASVDAPLVAVLWQWSLASVHGIRLPLGVYGVLWMVVWLIYVLDRTLDGLAERGAGVITARHAFYRRHRWWFLGLVLPVMAVTTGILVLTLLPEGLIWRGVAGGFLVGLYLLHYAGQQNRRFYLSANLLALAVGLWLIWGAPSGRIWAGMSGGAMKEILKLAEEWMWARWAASAGLLAMAAGAWAGWLPRWVRAVPKEGVCGLFFAWGCSLSVHFYSGDEAAGPLALETGWLALLGALNCILIGICEKETDAAGGHQAMVQRWPRLAQGFPWLLGIVALAVVGWACLGGDPGWAATVVGCLALLGLVQHWQAKMTPELSRVLADVALMIPLVLLWWLG